MIKVLVNYPVDWVQGHLRYGHKEGTLKMTEEEFEKFKSNPADFIKQNELQYYFDLFVDDWRIEDYDDDIRDVNFLIVEEDEED